jgi:hypothetical protein
MLLRNVCDVIVEKLKMLFSLHLRGMSFQFFVCKSELEIECWMQVYDCIMHCWKVSFTISARFLPPCTRAPPQRIGAADDKCIIAALAISKCHAALWNIEHFISTHKSSHWIFRVINYWVWQLQKVFPFLILIKIELLVRTIKRELNNLIKFTIFPSSRLNDIRSL